MAKYKITTVSSYYQEYEVEAENEATAEELVYTGEATLVDSYSRGEDEIYDVEELDG